MTKPLTAVAYLRVSTLGQVEHGASLEAQEATLRAEAERRGWDVIVMTEAGKSAKNVTGRPVLQEALTMLDKGQAQVLLAVRLDRVSRSVSDFAAMMQRAERRGWGITFTATAIDTTSAGGKFSAHVMAAAAEFERALISARTREGMAQKKAEGQTFGREVAAEFLPVYARVIKMHAAGQSMNSIAAQLTAEGVKTARGGSWAAATVRRIILSETAKSLA
jgi:DNA invertase Pin-like site-specific DNA recombinase